MSSRMSTRAGAKREPCKSVPAAEEKDGAFKQRTTRSKAAQQAASPSRETKATTQAVNTASRKRAERVACVEKDAPSLQPNTKRAKYQNSKANAQITGKPITAVAEEQPSACERQTSHLQASSSAKSPQPCCSPITSPRKSSHNIATQAVPLASPRRTYGTPAAQQPLDQQHLDDDAPVNLNQAARAAAVASTHFEASQQHHLSLVYETFRLGSELPSPVPTGRQQQFDQIKKVLRSCQVEGTGRSIYISGLPGTGKSFTVKHVVKALQEEAGSRSAASLSVTWLNCMALKDPDHVYATLLAECQASVTGKAAAGPVEADPEAAYNQLVGLLQSVNKVQAGRKAGKGAASAGDGKLVVIVLDEVDRLLSRSSGHLYKLFMMPHLAGVRCAVVALANSLDLTERMLPALRCRGCHPEFIMFPAYSKSQVLSILTSLSEHLPWPVFDSMALEVLARTVANSSGDIRQAIKACRIAVSLVPQQAAGAADAAITANTTTSNNNSSSSSTPAGPRTVSIREMSAALARLTGRSAQAAGAGIVNTIKSLPQQQQVTLLALATSVAAAAATTAANKAAAAVGDGSPAPQGNWGQPKRAANPFAKLDVTATPGAGAAVSLTGTAPSSAMKLSIFAGDAANPVALEAVYQEYCNMSKQMFQKPLSLPEFCDNCKLLANQALVGHSGLEARRGPATHRNAGAAAGTARLVLRVLVQDVRNALSENVVFKKLMGM